MSRSKKNDNWQDNPELANANEPEQTNTNEPEQKSEPEHTAATELEKTNVNRTKVSKAPSETEKDKSGFPIVGIGASAGGLAAIEDFFSGMPTENPGMSFILVQHLAPDHKSILSELIKRYTRLNVMEVTDGTVVEPNCAYIIAPNCDMAFMNGSLQLLEPSAPRGMRMPIDFFFRSLANDLRERAICVVLSGSGSDGTLGLRAIKGEGGMVMAQSPETADYDGMPSSAISTGLVDYVLPPSQMPAQLIAYARQAFSRAPNPVPKVLDGHENSLITKICVLLRDMTGHDFSRYKPSTLIRRVERRLCVHQIDEPETYLRYLRQNPNEANALFRDLLIGVTSFFRDAEAFDFLEKQIIPTLLEGKSTGAPLRIWCCGCSTGEEAYSVAILVREYMEIIKRSFNVQIFATDLDKEAIDQARTGVYPASISADVSSERLTRFFTMEAGGSTYRISKSIRDGLIFSEQDIIKDPPFSRLDLITCRNLLIYLNTQMQEKLIPLFHYALRPKGVLMLGPSETIGEFTPLFNPLHRKWKIYERRDDVAAQHLALGEFAHSLVKTGSGDSGAEVLSDSQINLRRLVEQNLLSHYAQSAVLVDAHGEIFHFFGRTGMFLEPAPGDAGNNILSMAREGLQRALTAALHKAAGFKQQVSYYGLQVRSNGNRIFVNLIVRPVLTQKGAILANRFMVILEETEPTTEASSTNPPAKCEANKPEGAGSMDEHLASIEAKLREKEEYLQAALEEMQTSNEELKSANEELQSVNEELQSTNEELETSKEELQSVNEELSTVNAELQNKLVDLCRANNDMNNVLSATGIATLFVDYQLRIVRFTPAATQLINLIQSDIGRPVGHIVSNLVDYNRLVEDTQSVLKDLVPREVEVRTPSGAWYLLRIRPYRTFENVIEGAVITFVDISEQKQCREAQRLAELLVDALPDPMLVLSENLEVLSGNKPFYKYFSLKPEETTGKKVFELLDDKWNIPELRSFLEIGLQDGAESLQIKQDVPNYGLRTIVYKAQSGKISAEQPVVILRMSDVTDKIAEQTAGEIRDGR